LWTEVNTPFLHYPVNELLFSWPPPNLLQIALKKNERRLFEVHEYAKLGLDEKDFSHSWDFWNPPSPSLRNLPL
jgi:hypothetical protein